MIAAPLTSILKTIRSSKKLASKAFKTDNNKLVEGGYSKTNETVVDLSKNKISKKSMCMPNIGAIKKLNFPTFDAKKAFNYLRLAFSKVLIL